MKKSIIVMFAMLMVFMGSGAMGQPKGPDEKAISSGKERNVNVKLSAEQLKQVIDARNNVLSNKGQGTT
jgi:hypothetical protein